jgi:hypothetical protein
MVATQPGPPSGSISDQQLWKLHGATVSLLCCRGSSPGLRTAHDVLHHRWDIERALGAARQASWRTVGSRPLQTRWTREGRFLDEGEPISYLALEVGTPVSSSSGKEFGTVHHVLQLPEFDLFDGISVKTSHGLRFVDRDRITSITTNMVRCALTDEEAASLPAPVGPPVVEADVYRDEGPRLTARLGRLFGREPWRNIDE